MRIVYFPAAIPVSSTFPLLSESAYFEGVVDPKGVIEAVANSTGSLLRLSSIVSFTFESFTFFAYRVPKLKDKNVTRAKTTLKYLIMVYKYQFNYKFNYPLTTDLAKG